MSMTVQTIDLGDVRLGNTLNQDELLTFGGAGTEPKGTILARATDTGKLIPYVKGGSTNGNGVPKAILEAAAVATGAGDVRVRPIVKGDVSKRRLIIKAAGDSSTVDSVVMDLLRNTGINVLDVADNHVADNQ